MYATTLETAHEEATHRASHGASKGGKRVHRAYPLYVHLSVLFSLLFLAVGGLIAWVGYVHGRDLTLTATARMFQQIGREIQLDFERVFQPVGRFVDVLAAQPLVEARTLDERLRALPVLHRAFRDGSVAAVYAGYNDGSFFLMRVLHNEHRQFGAPDGTRYLVQSIERGTRSPRPTYIYFDAELRELGRRRAPEYDYDPRSRTWWQAVPQAGDRAFTEPYVFFSTGVLGVTVAQRANARAVVGMDISLTHLSERLRTLANLPDMRMALFDAQRRVLARSDGTVIRRDGDLPTLEVLDDTGDPLLEGFDAAQHDGDTVDVQGREWKRVVLPIYTVSGPLYLGIAVPLDEVLAELRTIRAEHMLATFALLILAVPAIGYAARRMARPMQRATRLASDIRAFRFDGPPAGRSSIYEVDQLSVALEMMRETIRNFLDVAISLAGEKNFERLLQRVVRETCDTVDAVGGLVYLPDADRKMLCPASLVDRKGQPLGIEAPAVAVDATSPIASCYRDGITRSFELSNDSPEWPALSERAKYVLAIPLRERNGDCVGVLVLYIAEPPSYARRAFAEALSGTAAVAIEEQRLIETRKELLDSFIRLVAGAIDAKSPYTGGHCQRVPELTFMLARAACEAKSGPFKDFSLNERQWEALQIASWLHDCGKVTTPEYVVDKATKLETIYDRLHEIRMRFEVIKRDVEIETLKRQLRGEDAEALRAERERRWAELDEDFAFVARCNEGGETLAPEDVARLERIAKRTWQRTLDDRIGLSEAEKARKNRTPAAPLPATEYLLADKDEHLIERPAFEELSPDNPWGFKLRAPKYKYNRGELHNLRISRGTLTEEERYVINHHIVQTIIMLSQLPFPAHLRAVPEIAGGHHEKMDGTGYPRGLKRDEMSVEARMMAIADIFEALTAADRPYKKAKPLSEALGIMQRMKREGHIDPDLYELFIDSGVWRKYAERYLRPDQIDVQDAVPYR
ncbi:MAG: HD domain-containing phosphohydrolase [Pseudomonadota bacterium]|nr:MAG: hypothetical protein DIU74_03130 [Pseudomonadota bacterium]